MHNYRKPMDSDEEDEEYADTGLPPLPTAPPPTLDNLPPPPVAGRPPPRSPVPPPKSSPLPPTPPPKGESQTSLQQGTSGNSEFYIPTGSPIGSLKSPQSSSDNGSLLKSVSSKYDQYEGSSAEILLPTKSPKRYLKSPLPPPPPPPNKFKTSANTLPSESESKSGVLLPKRAPKRFLKTHLQPPPLPPDYAPHSVPSTDDMLPTLSPKRSPKSPLPPVPKSAREDNSLCRTSAPKSPLPSPPSSDKTVLPSLPFENEPELVSSEHIRLPMRSPEKSKSPFPPPSPPTVENGPSVDTVTSEFELESDVLLPTRSPSKSPKSPKSPLVPLTLKGEKIVSQRPTPAPRLSIRNSSAPSLPYRPRGPSLNSLPESLSHSRSENLLGRLSAPDYDRPPLIRSSLRPPPPPPIGELIQNTTGTQLSN